jgi:hypothetical protein
MLRANPATSVLMLQEAGPGAPGEATALPNPTGNPLVSVWQWNVGGSTRGTPWYLYFLQSNNPTVPGGRVNTIVASRTQADGVIVIPPPNPNVPGRPTIGIRLGNDWYFSYHALTRGGGDAVSMLTAIGQAVANAQPAGVTYNWTVGADFNTEPDPLENRQNYNAIPTPSGNPPSIVASGEYTHAQLLPDGTYAFRELDYAVTTTPNPDLLQADIVPTNAGSDHQAVGVTLRPPRPAPTVAAPEPTYSFDPMPAGGNAVNGSNASSTLEFAGMRDPVYECMLRYGNNSGKYTCAKSGPLSKIAQAAAASNVSFDYVGSVTAGDVGTGEDEEDAFPGATIDQIRQHLVTDLPTYKPDVVLLQLDVANDLATHSGLSVGQEASELQNLLNQIFYILPNTTVLLGDPTPSINPSIENEIYSGSGSYISQSNQIVANKVLEGHRIAAVPLDFENNTADLDTTASADGVPNDNGYVDMADNYVGLLLNLEQSGTIVDPGAVIVNPSGIIEDGSGIDDTGEAGTPGSGVCDIYGNYGTPCVGAYSMTRALYSAYNGPLYQVKRASDGTTANIGLLAAGGDVDASQQDSFCANTTCTITEIYDQSSEGNNLTIEGPGGVGGQDSGADATALPVTVGGNKAYGLDIESGTGYRNDSTSGIATGAQPEGMYMVASGTHVNAGCCFDFGNVETDNHDHGAGTMDAVNLTKFCGSYEAPCNGSGPWVEADLEDGQYLSGDGSNPADTSSSSDFVTAMLKNDGVANFELQGGDSKSGGLAKFWDGSLPPGYANMKKQGAIVLGTGGDNSNSDIGSFFEGVMTAGFPSDTADAAVQANIVAAGYSGSTGPTGAAVGPSAAGQALVHSGYSSVFTVDSANGHLRESYLPAMGDSWQTHDLSATGGTLPGTPPVMAGTEPVSVYHCGYTSVYTVDASSGDLQETYLSAPATAGAAWATQDLSANYHTPPTDTTPTAVVHSTGAGGGSAGCDGYTSVYSVNRNGDLQETYLPNQGFPGDGWHTQDLSGTGGSLPGTPPVRPGTAPVAIVHCGFTSVYTVDGSNGDLQETYLAAIGGSWLTQNLASYGTPPTDTTPAAAVHSAGAGAGSSGCDAYTSVYTVDQSNRDLDETYLPNQGFPGDKWGSQDLSANYHTPPVAPGTAPAALVHLGYTSVYTIDQGSGHLRETYLPAIGGGWNNQDLSVTGGTLPGTPVTSQTPIVLLHPDESGALDWASVFTVDEFSAHLQETYLSNVAFPGDAWATQDLSAKYHVPPVSVQQSSNPASWTVAHDGYTSAYTVDASSGDLDETYLPAAASTGVSWKTQDLSKAPKVAAGTKPVALYHDGYTSVYTVDAGTGHLQETYLPFMGGSWSTQDLSARDGAPVTGVTPAAVFHDGYTSVYTVDDQGDLHESFLPAMGDKWQSQDLTANYHAPKALNIAPAALYHDGYTSVYYLSGPGDDLTEAYLPAISGSWGWQDLSSHFQVPASVQAPSALVHYGTDGGLTWASVFTIDSSNSHLQETYLPDAGFPGDSWKSQDLSANYQTPAGDPSGSVMYSPSSGNEGLGYARTIRLANGDLLATFEHATLDGTPSDYVIQRSTDDGATWSTLSTVPGDVNSLAPFLYEYPQQLGSFPAGTLMLLGNTRNGGGTNAAIREWLSFDHGASWTSVGVVQSSSGGIGDGIWEPFVTLDSSGHLALFFSDERQNATYSQFIGEIISTDGGLTWTANPDGSTNYGPGEIKVVASPYPADRAGMATVAQMGSGGGDYALSYEMCGPQNCSVHIKTSTTADFWGSGPTDLGTVAETSDGLFLQGTPVITWVETGGVDGTLFLSGRMEASTTGSVPQNQTVILANDNGPDGPDGPWSWLPAPPIPTTGGDPAVCGTPNYSPDLMVSHNGTSLLYTTAAVTGSRGCEEITASVPISY